MAVILGAGAPAKTKNYNCEVSYIFFREKVRPFPHLAKQVNTPKFKRAGKVKYEYQTHQAYCAGEKQVNIIFRNGKRGA